MGGIRRKEEEEKKSEHELWAKNSDVSAKTYVYIGRPNNTEKNE